MKRRKKRRLMASCLFNLALTMALLCASLAQSTTPARHNEQRESQTLAHLTRARQAMANRQLDLAGNEYTSILSWDPGNVEARGDLGVVQYLQGHYDEARQNLLQALKRQPSLWKAQAILGLCEQALGQPEVARPLLEKSFPHLQDAKVQVLAGLALAELEYHRRDYKKTLSVLDTLQQRDPANVNVLYAVYRIHADLATQARNSLALVAPDSARMHQLLAQHLVNEGDAKAAVEQYREALRVDPRLPGVHFELGEALLQVSAAEPGQQEAQKEFEAALALNPEDVKSECRLGDLLSLHGDQRAALDHYTHAVMVDPNEPEAQAGLGKVLLALSQPEQALAHLLDAERLDPLNAGIHYRLSQTYRVLGRMPEAEKEVARFQELRKAEDRLHSAYSQVYKDSSSSETLNPDIPH